MWGTPFPKILSALRLVTTDLKEKSRKLRRLLPLSIPTTNRARALARREDVETKPPPTGWVESPLSLAATLEAIAQVIRRYVVISPEGAWTLSLWVFHTHTWEAAEQTPYIAILSPTMRSGKSAVFDVLQPLVRSPFRVVDVTPASLFRATDQWRPTLLIDEADLLEKSRHLQAILNAGNRPGNPIPRTETIGGARVVVRYETYCPKALAGIEGVRMPLAATVLDRSIVIRLSRRLPEEQVERWRRRSYLAKVEPLVKALPSLAESCLDELACADPDLPPELNDRAQDAWEPLLAIAELAGDPWPERASKAALLLSAGSEEEREPNVLLLADIHTVFDCCGKERLPTRTLIQEIGQLDYGEFEGPLSPRELARYLKPFGIRSKKLRFGHETAQGYERRQFEETWRRYLT